MTLLILACAVVVLPQQPAAPGWLQIVLVLPCGIAGWLLLRPYRRMALYQPSTLDRRPPPTDRIEARRDE
ncbi:MAG TPA: hypothetical protein VH561_05155 [Micromonosporaceae bacterium]|jgi:hypothetical protein